MARPGMMLYFDILPALDKLPSSAVGELLLAALHYAQDGIEPAFEDSSLGFAWAFLRPAIDRDGATYEGKRLKGDWLTYCRQCKKDGVDALDFETWHERVDNGTLHTVDVSTTAPIPTTTTTPNNIGTDKPPTPARRKYGGYGWIRLTDDEHSRLVSDLGQAELDRCIQYIDPKIPEMLYIGFGCSQSSP